MIYEAEHLGPFCQDYLLQIMTFMHYSCQHLELDTSESLLCRTVFYGTVTAVLLSVAM